MRALCGITESQLTRTAASTCTRYGLKSTPAGSLKSCRLLRAGPGDGALGFVRVGASSMSPIIIPPAGAAGAGFAGVDGVRSKSERVLAIGGSFTLGFAFGCDEVPPAPTGSNASLGFSTGGGAACGRFPGEAGGGGGTTAASIL